MTAIKQFVYRKFQFGHFIFFCLAPSSEFLKLWLPSFCVSTTWVTSTSLRFLTNCVNKVWSQFDHQLQRVPLFLSLKHALSLSPNSTAYSHTHDQWCQKTKPLSHIHSLSLSLWSHTRTASQTKRRPPRNSRTYTLAHSSTPKDAYTHTHGTICLSLSLSHTHTHFSAITFLNLAHHLQMGKTESCALLQRHEISRFNFLHWLTQTHFSN